MMESLADIENRKCFLVELSTGEQYIVIESMCKVLDHVFIIDTGSATEEVPGWDEEVTVDFEAKLARDGRESGPLWVFKGGASRRDLAWRG